MTLVLASVFKEGTLVLSDSRASTENGINADILQKIVGINKDTIVGYAGVVAAVNRVLTTFQAAISTGNPDNAAVLNELQKTSEDEFKKNGQGFSLLLFTRTNNSWSVNLLESPKFNPEPVHNIELIGSGSTIKPKIVPLYESIVDDKENLKSKADRIIWNVSSLLASSGAQGVGGLIQALLLTPQGVQTIHTGFIDVNPEGTPESKQIIYEGDHWVQRNYASGKDAVIIAPNQLLQQPVHNAVFHHYETSVGRKHSKWYLNCFLTSIGISIEPFETKFIGQLTATGVPKLPTTINFMAYLSLWGPSTEHTIEIIHIAPSNERVTIYQSTFDNTNFPHEFELVEEMSIKAKAPGNHYLQCKIDGQVAGTKLIYIHEVDEALPTQQNGKNLEDGQRSTEDKMLTNPELAWFFVGTERGELKPESHTIKGQFSVVYINKFPLNWIGYANFGIRAKPGSYRFNIQMMDAANHEILSEAASTLTCSSTSIVQPCEVKFDLTFPKPGIYFVTLKINDVMKGCIVVMADSDHPTMSYNLPDEELKKLHSSDLMFLAKRPRQKED